jgi:hypothetical protein
MNRGAGSRDGNPPDGIIRAERQAWAILDPIDWDAVRTADRKITNTVNTEAFLLQELEAA